MRIEGPISLRPQATPATDGHWHLYLKADGRLYTLSPAGDEEPVAIEGGGAPELVDAATAPADPPATYLRFERDLDGDVQAIYLGTVD